MNGYLNSIAIAVYQIKELELDALDAEVMNALCEDVDSAIQFDREQSDLLPSVENGTNRYGVDVSYFRNTINRELNRSLRDFRPDELARVFARLSRTADPEVMHEPEFRLTKECTE